MKKPVIYLAGPYTNPDPIINTHDTIQVATRIYEEGWCVPFVPHLTLLWHMVTPRPLEFWYDLDLAHMETCDAVWRLPGESSGADAEVAHAKEIGMPVFTSEEEVQSWAVKATW